MANVAELFVDVLRDAGVKRVYGVPGDSLNGFTDALRHQSSLEWIHLRHEEGAAFSATAEAALTGELAVCAASCGPGNLHFINGLFDANRSRVPVLAIASHIPSSEIGTGYFQETHPQDLFRECSVYCEMVGVVDQLPRVLEIAMRSAVERRGVAVVVVPGEIFLQTIDHFRVSAPIRQSPSISRPTDSELTRAAALLNESGKVTIFGGAGTEGAHAEVLELASTLNAPIVHTLRGKEFLEYDNPFDVGMTGLLGFSAGYRAIEDCDLLIMLGTDFPYRQFLPKHAKIIQVDIRGEHLGKRTPIDLGLVGSVTDTLQALIPHLEQSSDDSHLKGVMKHYTHERKNLDSLAVNDHDRTPIHPEFVARTISEMATEDTVFIPDVGSPIIWSARHLKMNGQRRLIGSFNHGSMANALPHAIGAQAAFPDRQVVTLSGDGGLSMLLGELLTLRQNSLPVKIVVFNNSSLNFVELEMKAAGIPAFGTDLVNPNFADVANAVGVLGKRVEHPSDLQDAMKAAFEHDGPALVDVLTAPQELSMPPNITLAEAKGFSLWALKSVISGRGDELIDLADTNLIRRLFSGEHSK